MKPSVWAAKTVLLAAGAVRFASAFQAPAPTWPADGVIPDSEKNQFVFLSPDQHSVVVALPSSDPAAPRTTTTVAIHNRLDAQTSVEIKKAASSFVYRYTLSIAPDSVDTVNDFDVVVSADPNIEVMKNNWGGMIATVDIAKRIGLRYAPPGRFIAWLSPDSEPLHAGAKADFFVITSANRPGFTTAYIGRFPAVELPGEWREEVIDQLDPIADPAWVEKHIITFGPRYADSDSPQKMAQDYLAGIADLVRSHRLALSSRFVQEISAQLRAISAGSSSGLDLRAAPGSPMEEELRQAAVLCFERR